MVALSHRLAPVALPADTDLLALHRAWPQRYPMLLESAASGGRQACWDILHVHDRNADGGGIVLDCERRLRTLGGEPLEGGFLAALDAQWRAAVPLPARDDLPFQGGWALYLGYELAAEVEPILHLPAAVERGPIAIALRCPAAVLRHRGSGEVFAVAEPGHADLLARIAADARELVARGQTALPMLEVPTLHEDPSQHFRDGVARVHDYLCAGDVFQVNLSRGWRAQFTAPVEAAVLYAALRAANPAPFAGLLAGSNWALISSSPERLVSVRGRNVQTRPIAGTRPRSVGDDDAAKVRELIGHPKERAEHVMLIDLERNDLGRVCTPGSVCVDEIMAIESYPHVHHIVSNVSGILREGVSPGEVIRAVFPGGTITGCPKVRCMQIIAELEGEGRGAYTGAMGYLDRSGDMDLNILIRSAWLSGDTLRFRAGAGLVVDSDADAELAETRAKARGLLRAWGVDG
ncbi:MAG: aminodeoxychorismate synthase, component I [Gammaproteobacteria bacterium HGW-Gammaproteobacteria-4]|jgi:anthranilate synthase component 1|nr:MAG: aminodeoxychorismate synthase, component I [Gammaproteobacteria bacterium HGW-Gammaproteobacteria-4]